MERIFRIWPTLKEMAAELGKPYPTVAAWHQRRSIPAKYDAEIVRAAKKRGQNVSFETLALERASQPQTSEDAA
jgi:hypothetical protein